MYLAELAGIKVFATGGIGGVHRGGEDTMDVSADLNEFGRTRMCVIASGCKSFLDIPRTLEYLETQGVTVATFSDKDEVTMPFPAFYTRDSGVTSPLVARGAQEAASIICKSSVYALYSSTDKLDAQELLGSNYGAGFLLANPIPEEFAVPKEDIDTAIEAAVSEANAQGIRGHANTPFILAHIKKVTEGKSVIANRALIKSNVQVAADVIKSYHEITRGKDSSSLSYSEVGTAHQTTSSENSNLDPGASESGNAQAVTPVDHTESISSKPSQVCYSCS